MWEPVFSKLPLNWFNYQNNGEKCRRHYVYIMFICQFMTLFLPTQSYQASRREFSLWNELLEHSSLTKFFQNCWGFLRTTPVFIQSVMSYFHPPPVASFGGMSNFYTLSTQSPIPTFTLIEIASKMAKYKYDIHFQLWGHKSLVFNRSYRLPSAVTDFLTVLGFYSVLLT